jgi:N-methylhydantoinase A
MGRRARLSSDPKSPRERARDAMRIGVDTGGTFTDCVVMEYGVVRVAKVFSTPEDPARGMMEGIRLLRAGARDESLEIIHGTTVGTNSLLERRGARVGLVTTAGFEDLIEIGRQNRPKLYDFNVRREPPLVPRQRRWGIAERTAAGGKVLARPSPRAIRELIGRVRSSRAESLAVCLLFSFASPSNEQTLARALRKLRLPVSVSSEILPEFREYERFSTVVVNAYLTPRLRTYFEGLAKTFHAPPMAGEAPRAAVSTREARMFVMQSSGGITTAERAAREPVRTILSGPAGGVMAAAKLAGRLGIEKAISFDMGGTSTDVCLLPAQTTHETWVAGLPVAVPVLDVHTVGAGGGSIARLDAGGALRVGPESAGAVPGPLCYGRGTEPTVTDAHVILGRLAPDHFLGGEFRLDHHAAEEGFRRFCESSSKRRGRAVFGNSVELALGVVRVANATMERALRVISVERGRDPRDYALICFGGAGGLHAADLARALGLKGVIVPPNPGTFSALGILSSDIVYGRSESLLSPVPARGSRPSQAFTLSLDRRFEELERAGRSELARDGFDRRKAVSARSVDVRYAGQSYELTVPFTPDFERRFEQAHESAHGYFHEGRALELVTLRVRLTIPVAEAIFRHARPNSRGRLPKPLGTKSVWFGEGQRSTRFYARQTLAPGSKIPGPAVFMEYSSTTVVPPDFTCRLDEHLNLRLERAGEN